MISLAGNLLLLLALTASILVIFIHTKNNSYIFFISSIAIITSFLLLVFSFINSDFSIKNVFLNSSTIKPLIYKIAGSWASHEGSVLLYLTLLSLVSSIYIKISNFQFDTKNLQITILAFIQTLFLCFIYFTSNPFDNFKFAPVQGLGLNPVLQDKALSIHPPLLYMGYVSYVTTYVNAMLLLLRPAERKNILQNNLNFSSFALLTLTAGIGLGSWWAYRELGWGGYWFFDPVENISLMPWLTGIALHHFLLISNKSENLLKWTIITSFLTFLLTIFGIFLVRSGIISSVHSFAFSAERGLYLFIICTILTLIAIITYIWKKDDTNLSIINKKMINKDKIILAGNILWIGAFLTLFIALIYPLFYSLFYNIDIAINPEYFQKIFIPIFIPIILLAAITPYLYTKLSFKHLLYILTATVAVIITYNFSSDLTIITSSIIFASVFLIIQMIDLSLVETNYFTQYISCKKLSLIVGHLSLGLLAFTITINILFSKEIEFIGKIGDTVFNKNFEVKLNNIKFNDGVVYYRQIAEFTITDSTGNIVTLKPENRLYKIEQTLSQEADIYSYLTHDIFAVLSKIEGDRIHAIIYYRPLIYFIWFSVFLMVITFFIYLLKNKES